MDTFTYVVYKTLRETPLKEEPKDDSKTLTTLRANRLLIILSTKDGWSATAYGYIKADDLEYSFTFDESLDES